jgi:hypothetical protein
MAPGVAALPHILVDVALLVAGRGKKRASSAAASNSIGMK